MLLSSSWSLLSSLQILLLSLTLFSSLFVVMATSSKISATPSAILICTLVDGSVVSMDVGSGQIISSFSTGRPLVGSSSPSTIVPSLDGGLYMQRDGEMDMQLLPTSIQDVLNSPVKTCVGNDCGIITGTKITSLYGLEMTDGRLVWTSHLQSRSEEMMGSVVVLQREDFVVQQISTSTGDQVWNVTYGRFNALNFGEAGFLLGEAATQQPQVPRIEGRTTDQDGKEDPTEIDLTMPPIAFDEQGLTLIVLADDGILWQRKLPSIIAQVYGVKGGMWAPLEVVQEPITAHDNALVPLLPEPPKLFTPPERDLILDMLIQEMKNQKHGLVIYQTPMLFGEKNNKLPSDMSIPSIPIEETCLETDDGNTVCTPLIPQPQAVPHTIIEEPHLRPSQSEGLFLTWDFVFGLLAIMMASVVALFFFYQKKKQKWLATPQISSKKVQQHAGEPEPLQLPGQEQQFEVSMPEPSHTGLLSQSSSLHIKRSMSMPVMKDNLPRRGSGISTSLHRKFSDEERPHNNLGRDSIMELPEETQTDTSYSQPTSIEGLPLVRYSRYESEFREISALGKGGFGTVFECENLLDGRKYAIKKVGVQVYDDPQITRDRLQRVLREVKILAVLDHPNIVRYYTAWLELQARSNHDCDSDPSSHYLTNSKFMSKCYSSELLTAANDNNQTCTSDYNDRPSETGRSRNRLRKRPQRKQPNPLGWNNFMNESFSQASRRVGSQNSLDDFGFTFDRSGTVNGGVEIIEEKTNDSSSSDDYTSDENTIHGDRSFSQSFSMTKAKTTAVPETKAPATKTKVRHTLYIQMQLCSQKTLGYFLSSKEARSCSELEDGEIDIPYALSLFTQIAQGVKFIHNQSLIHRDLKPSNCFLDDTGVVKVGDFGLSRGSSAKEAGLNDSFNEDLDHLDGDGDNTAGVGTRSYASPEQMNGSDYDASTDVYSLGIMLFELCYPMYTGMERHIVFSKIRNHDFPETWTNGVAKAFPSLHSMLHSMLCKIPSSRPSASAVATHMQTLMGEFTVLSIDKSHSERGATLLRIEADPVDGILTRTIKLINDSAPQVKIEQYGLRGEGQKTIMEFALSSLNSVESMRTLLTKIKSSEEIKVVRQVSSKRHHGEY